MMNRPNQLTNMWLQPETSQTQRVAVVQGSCVVSLQKYMSVWNNRPQDNNMNFWFWFTSEFYTCTSRRMLCLTSYRDEYDPTTNRKIKRFFKESWPCVYCKVKPTHGYEVSFHEMPCYFHNKFSSVQRETLRLGRCEEHKFQSGNTLICFAEAVEEATQNAGSTSRMGSLAILFAPNNKIISWRFCMRRSEYLVKSSAVLPQICELLKIVRGISTGQVCIQDKTESNKLSRNMYELGKKFDLKQINKLGLTEEDLKTFFKLPSIIATNLENRSINPKLNMQLRMAPPRFQPTGLAAQPECTNQISNPKKRPCPENNSGIDPQQYGSMSQSIEGPSTSLRERDRPEPLAQTSSNGKMEAYCSEGGVGKSLVNRHQPQEIADLPLPSSEFSVDGKEFIEELFQERVDLDGLLLNIYEIENLPQRKQ